MVADFIGTMNLFPARVLGAAGPGLKFGARGLGAVELPHASGAAGEVGLAVRPEKVEIRREPPGAGAIAARGRVARITYFGDYSHIGVEIEPEVHITCYRTHSRRRHGEPLAVGDACWVFWDPADVILLTE